MNTLNNGDLYSMLLDKIRKDRKGLISPTEFEHFLRWRNIDYFNKQINRQGSNQDVDESLAPFLITQDLIPISTSLGEYYALLRNTTVPAQPQAEYDVERIVSTRC